MFVCPFSRIDALSQICSHWVCNECCNYRVQTHIKWLHLTSWLSKMLANKQKWELTNHKLCVISEKKLNKLDVQYLNAKWFARVHICDFCDCLCVCMRFFFLELWFQLLLVFCCCCWYQKCLIWCHSIPRTLYA